MSTVQDGFGAGDASRLSGVAIANLDYWARSGFLPPSLQEGRGKGSQRRYSFQDLVALRVAGQLREAGISLQALRRVIAHLRARGVDQPLASTYLVSDGKDVYEVHGDAAISTLRQPGQSGFLWLVDLGSVVAELRQAIAA
jgi:DNA-binding transcriptional MerR regulator